MKINFLEYEKEIVMRAKRSERFIPGMEWEDIAQEFRIHIWQKRDTFQPHKGASEKTYVMRILRNKEIDLKRKAEAQKRFIDNHHLVFSQLEKAYEGRFALMQARPIP